MVNWQEVLLSLRDNLGISNLRCRNPNSGIPQSEHSKSLTSMEDTRNSLHSQQFWDNQILSQCSWSNPLICLLDLSFLSNSAIGGSSFHEWLQLSNVNSLECMICEHLPGNFPINSSTENATIHMFILNNACVEIRESHTVSVFLFCTVPLRTNAVLFFFVPSK